VNKKTIKATAARIEKHRLHIAADEATLRNDLRAMVAGKSASYRQIALGIRVSPAYLCDFTAGNRTSGPKLLQGIRHW